MNRRFRIYRCPCTGAWRWVCTLCDPPAEGARFSPDAWDRIVAVSMPRHFRVRSSHHEFVHRTKGKTA